MKFRLTLCCLETELYDHGRHRSVKDIGVDLLTYVCVVSMWCKCSGNNALWNISPGRSRFLSAFVSASFLNLFFCL